MTTETNAKKLEEIIKRSAIDQCNDFFRVALEDMNWLVEQTQELERNLKHGAQVAVRAAEKLYYAQQEIDRLREALEFYADESIYLDTYSTEYSETLKMEIYVNNGTALSDDDYGERARQALKGESE